MTRTREETGYWRKKRQVALFWELALEGAMYLSYDRLREMSECCLQDIHASKGFYVLLTVHCSIIFVNKPNWCKFFLYIFISIVYRFRAAMCPSSGEVIVSMRHLVYATLCRWPSGMQVGMNSCLGDRAILKRVVMYWHKILLDQWRTQEFCSAGGFNKFSWGQRTERTGIWGR